MSNKDFLYDMFEYEESEMELDKREYLFDDYEGCDSGIDTSPIPPCLEGLPHKWIKKLDGYKCLICDHITKIFRHVSRKTIPTKGK